MASYSELVPKSLALGPLQASSKSKSASILFDGAPLRVLLASPSAPLRVPFEWGNFDQSDAARVQICLEVGEALQAWVERIEDLAVQKMAEMSEQFFKKKLSVEDTRRIFCSALRTNNGVLFKLKVNRAGPNAVKCWTADGQTAEIPSFVRGSHCSPLAEVKSIWASGSQWGLLWQISDAVFAQPQRSFPWGSA